MFHIYKTSKDSLVRYYQKNKERLRKRARERYQNLSKEEEKNNNMVVNDIKIPQKMKNKGWLSIEKIL